jgi:hypothetical protein
MDILSHFNALWHSLLHCRGRHVPKLSGNGREDTIGKVNTSEME